MKYTKLIFTGILTLVSFAYVNAQQTMYVMQTNGTNTEFAVSAVDSIIFYDPGTGGGGGGGTGEPGAKCGDFAHVTKNAQTPASGSGTGVIYSNNFGTDNTGTKTMVAYKHRDWVEVPSTVKAYGYGSESNGEMTITITEQATNQNFAWEVAFSQYQGGIPFLKGNDYEFSISMRTSGSGGKNATVVVQENNVDYNGDGIPYSGVVGKDFHVDGTMQTYTCKWRPHFSSPNSRLLIWSAEGMNDLTIDNIRITHIGPASTPGSITTQAGLPEFDCATANFQEAIGAETPFSSPEPTSSYTKSYTYSSPSNGNQTVGLRVVLPPDYATNTSRRYPVVYFLHGHGATEASIQWFGVDKTVADGMASNAIDDVIFISVGGPRDSWYSDGDNGVMAESHIIYEILPLVDANFRTLGTQESRSIMGFSMGGWGATKIAIKYPGFFKGVMSWCGALYSPGPAGSSINGGFWDGITSRITEPGPTFGHPHPGFRDDYTAIWSDNTEDYAYDCGRAMLPVQASLIKSEQVQFFIHENYDPSYLGGARYNDQFWNHANDFVKECQDLGITVQKSESICIKDGSNPNDAAPHSPKNITAADIQKLLNVMQVN